MDPSTIISAAMYINEITDLNTFVLDGKNEFIYQDEKIVVPAFMPGSEQVDLIYLTNEIELLHDNGNQLYSYTNAWGLNYLGYTFTKEETYTIIIGPYMERTPDLYNLFRVYKLNNNEREHLKAFSNQIQVLSVEKIQSFSNILQLFDQLILVKRKPVLIESRLDPTPFKTEKKHPNKSEETEIITMRYKIETDLIHAVEQGNKSKATKLLNSNSGLFSFTERLPNQPLRRHKNLAIVLNSLLRTAVRRSQVPPILIHRVSEQFAFEIENANKLAKIQRLHDQMVEDYCNLVLSHTLNKYSKITKIAIEHLMAFYDQKLDKNELAELCFTHPNHLSRKFKQETNKTLTGYQQMLRINKAKHLLQHEQLSVEEISWLVGYEDSSYFTRVFKKETGQTPSQFKESNSVRPIT